MNQNTKIRLLQLFNYLVTIFAIVYLVQTQQYTYLWATLIVWFLICPIGVVITLHRLLTHRSFETYPWLEKILTYISVISTVGPTISWVAVHRQHHSKSDREGDPHSPYIDGRFSFIQAFKVWSGYGWEVPSIPLKFVKDLMRSPTHKFIFKYYFKIIFAYCAVLILIDPVLFLFAYSVPASCTIAFIGLTNVLGHAHGYRNHNTKDHSTNSWIANIISLGEGWHNNHHNSPNKYYTGEQWWEWDLCGLIIKAIKTN